MLKNFVRSLLARRGIEIYRPANWTPADDTHERGKRIAGRDQVVDYFCQRYSFHSIVDVGCGKGALFPRLLATGAKVCGVDILPAARVAREHDGREAEFIQSWFFDFTPEEPFDAVVASHVVEHVADTERFLKHFIAMIRPGGSFCLIWPLPKKNIVGGHVHVFNAGLMLYNLVRIGVDCRQVEVLKCGYSLAIVGKLARFDVPDLACDDGDIETLSAYFPFPAEQDFDGDNLPGMKYL